MKKLSSILLALTLGFVTANAETVTIKQSSTITEDKVVNLSKEELKEVNQLSAELKDSGLSIKDLESGKAITADQATKLNRIVQIIEKNSLAAAATGSSTIAAGATFSVTTLTALSAGLLTAIALGSSDSSASTHSHH